MTENQITLSLDRVTKQFDDFTAVRDLSLNVRAGRIFGLLGPNGAGKTTTIRMIVGITAPDEGRIELFSEPLSEKSQERVGYLPEERGLYKRMKVGEQLRFFGELKGMSGRDADAATGPWLDKLKLSEWKNRKVSELSKGMQQKIQFIAAVLHDPDLLILDEPFSGLDPVNAELLQEIVLDLKSKGKSIILSTHQMRLAEDICDDICLIDKARKVLEGGLREVRRGFGKNAVAVRTDAQVNALQGLDIVAAVRPCGDFDEILLADGADPQDLLKFLIMTGASISRFERVEPSLHDIFIEQVRGNTA